MARFRATIAGKAKNVRSALGSEKTGIVVNVNGWNLGIEIVGSVVNGRDRFEVYKTYGSWSEGKKLIAAFEEA